MPKKGAAKSYEQLEGPDGDGFNKDVKKLPKGKQKKLAQVGRAIVGTRNALIKAVRKGS